MFVMAPLSGSLGLAVARNFRGLAEWHVRKTFQIMRPFEGALSKVPPWKQALSRPIEERIQAQIRMERRGGWLFAVVSVLMFVGGAAAFVGWLA
jgi:hypothetical protein